MRIRDSLTSRAVDKNKSGSPLKKAGGDSLFASTLTTVQDGIDSYAQEIEALKKEIDVAGDRLEQEPNLDNFKKFRDLLSQLAKRVSAEAYRLEKVGGTPQNPRYFEVINVINREADNLYRLIINEQRNRMAIIEKVIGIKGLVVDLIT